MKKWILCLISGLLLACVCLGCARHRPSNSFVRQNFDFSFVKKIAVVPFDNLTNDKFAAEHIRRLTINELLVAGMPDVLISGEVSALIKPARGEQTAALSSEDIKKIGKALNAEAVLTGAVERYEEPKGGATSAPEITISLIMYETDSAAIIWSVTASSGGAGFATRHFGARTDTISEAAAKVVKAAIRTLLR